MFRILILIYINNVIDVLFVFILSLFLFQGSSSQSKHEMDKAPSTK
jgi:hypothetical protein